MGVKLGAEGCALASTTETACVPAWPAAVLDTCGAGDAWSAAVIYGWRLGWPLAEIGRFANAAGALCTESLGATAGLRDAAAIRQRIHG